MPWEVSWTEHVVNVRITPPVPLIQDAAGHLGAHHVQDPRRHLPSTIEGGTAGDEERLTMLWRAVTDPGMVVQRAGSSGRRSRAGLV